jgi:hypothetical protein
MKKEIAFVFVIAGVFVIFASYLVVSQAAGRFTIGNEDPLVVAGTFAVQEADGATWDSTTFDTHELSTLIRFNVKDPNPDTLEVRLCVGTAANPSTTGDCDIVNYEFFPPPVAPGAHAGASGAQLVYTYGTDPTGTLEGTPGIIELLQADCTGDFCTKTYFVDIIVDDGNGGVITDTGKSFSVFDNLPTFTDVYLSGNAVLDTAPVTGDSCVEFAPADYCDIIPDQGTYSSIEAQLTVTDIDGDCSAAHTGTLVLCLEDITTGGACDDVTNNYRTYPLAFSSNNGNDCFLTASIPKADPTGLEFYIAPGDYKLYTVASESGRESTAFATDYGWSYTSLIAPSFPASVDLGDGDIQLGQLNPGTSLATVINEGNVDVGLDWDATDASLTPPGGESCNPSTTTCWDLTTDGGLQIDDDIDPALDTGNVAVATIPETDGGTTVVTFEPAGGLVKCTTLACNTLSGETLDTYFHITPPIGLQTGDYETTIKFYTSAP